MDEIKRMQQIAGLLNEIKVNNPLDQYLVVDWDEDNHVLFQGNIQQVKDWWWKVLEEDGIDDYTLYSKEEYDKIYNDDEDKELDEDVSNFKIGQTSQQSGRKTTVTDIDPTTQSVTWSVQKDVSDQEIYKDLSELIRKFEIIQTKDFHSRPKLIQLIKDLKTIRNKFSRTIPK